jgi:hypothetical protein
MIKTQSVPNSLMLKLEEDFSQKCRLKLVNKAGR